MRLANKVALITGGNSGIGLATARIFLAEGAKVAITGRNRQTLDQAAQALGQGVLAIRADATDPAELVRATGQVAAAFGGIDVVFANAGIAGATPLGETSLEAFEQIIRTNLTSVFFTVQAALPHLREGGSVILNGSVHATLGIPGYSAYAATKGAVRSMTRNLAAELATRGIRVNQVTPGGTKTPIWSASTEQAMDQVEARLSRGIPLGRMAEADDIAKAVLYLASDDAKNVSGAELVVDGAATSAPYGAPVHRAA